MVDSSRKLNRSLYSDIHQCLINKFENVANYYRHMCVHVYKLNLRIKHLISAFRSLEFRSKVVAA